MTVIICFITVLQQCESRRQHILHRISSGDPRLNQNHNPYLLSFQCFVIFSWFMKIKACHTICVGICLISLASRQETDEYLQRYGRFSLSIWNSISLSRLFSIITFRFIHPLLFLYLLQRVTHFDPKLLFCSLFYIIQSNKEIHLNCTRSSWEWTRVIFLI